MTNHFDLIVIGTGAAGASAATECRSAGWNVAIVDSRPFGGTCALRGCDPKKVLVGATEVIERNRQMAGNGVAPDGVKIDWPALMRFKRCFTQPVPADREQRFSEAGIAIFHDRARFTDKTTIQVGEDTLTGVSQSFEAAKSAALASTNTCRASPIPPFMLREMPRPAAAHRSPLSPEWKAKS